MYSGHWGRTCSVDWHWKHRTVVGVGGVESGMSMGLVRVPAPTTTSNPPGRVTRPEPTDRVPRRSTRGLHTSLSWCSISPISFARGKGVRSARGKGVCASGQLGKWVDGGVGGRNRVGWRRGPCGAWGAGFDKGRRGSIVLLLLNCSLHCVIGVVVGSSLSLRQREDNGSENRSEVVSR